jgi:hypothetical protein
VETPTLKLVDMYAKAEGHDFNIHIYANGDISQYKTTRQVDTETYKLILDVPALPPLDSKYDLATPFSTRFEVWPMMLGNQVYSRISIVLANEASSVVSLVTPSHMLVTISRKSPIAMADTGATRVQEPTAPPVEIDTEPAELEAVSPVDTAQASGSSPSKPPMYDETAQVPAEPVAGVEDEPVAPMADSENQEFFSLFPVPAEGRRPIFDIPVDQTAGETGLYDGIRLGRFLVRPMVYVGYIRGTNLILLSEEDFRDSAIMLRGRVAFDLLESENTLKFIYEARFKDYKKFMLDDRLSHLIDLNSALNVTPRMTLQIRNHFARANTESAEFDPGREVAFSTEPFYRNVASGALQMDLSERVGVELFGSYNFVQFVDDPIRFYNYDQTTTGASFLYYMSPLTTLFGQYQHLVTPEPVGRPEAASTGDAALFGIRGEITPLMTGQIRAGFQNQEFGIAGEQPPYRGFVADVQLMRHFSEKAALAIDVGRSNNLSNFESNGYYTSNYLNLHFITPIWHDLRLSTRAAFIDNSYPLPSTELGVPREERNYNVSIGVAYFFTRHGFFQVDYLHEKRKSNLESYRYRNNVLQLLVGWGFLSQ